MIKLLLVPLCLCGILFACGEEKASNQSNNSTPEKEEFVESPELPEAYLKCEDCMSPGEVFDKLIDEVELKKIEFRTICLVGTITSMNWENVFGENKLYVKIKNDDGRIMDMATCTFDEDQGKVQEKRMKIGNEVCIQGDIKSPATVIVHHSILIEK